MQQKGVGVCVCMHQARWHRLISPAQGQEEYPPQGQPSPHSEFQNSQDYIVRPYLNKNKANKQNCVCMSFII